jgi:hypothetical protein
MVGANIHKSSIYAYTNALWTQDMNQLNNGLNPNSAAGLASNQHIIVLYNEVLAQNSGGGGGDGSGSGEALSFFFWKEHQQENFKEQAELAFAYLLPDSSRALVTVFNLDGSLAHAQSFQVTAFEEKSVHIRSICPSCQPVGYTALRAAVGLTPLVGACMAGHQVIYPEGV